VDSLHAIKALGDRLTHLHLCDGDDNGTDQHLQPGLGTQPVAQSLEYLAASGWQGSATVEVTTRKYRKTPGEVERVLGETLEFARKHLAR
jgi:sugar phosphate isomerase/epimerase